MAYEQKPNSGSLFKNDDKRDGKQDADYRGSALIGGVEYYLDAWINTKKDGHGKYLGVKYKPKNPPAEVAVAQSAPSLPVKPGTDADFDDDIPF